MDAKIEQKRGVASERMKYLWENVIYKISGACGKNG